MKFEALELLTQSYRFRGRERTDKEKRHVSNVQVIARSFYVRVIRFSDAKTRRKIRPNMENRSADRTSQHDRMINSVWFESS